jgi:asparagine synthase (glutamine-hydrolysing)
MSAICGIMQLTGKALPPDALNSMMTALQHRGPDGSEIWSGGSCGLGHQMLHVTPESISEKLPYYDEESGLAITAVVRLDNRRDLLDMLGITPNATTMPDSLLILKAYKKWGDGCHEKLLGDFAFAITDVKKRKLFLATDHLGRTPLYYYQTGHYFLFSTEIKGILAFPEVSIRLDLTKIAMLSIPLMMFQDKTTTFFSGVKRMPAACVMTITENGIMQSTYWKPEVPTPLHFRKEEDFVAAFQAVFAEAVRTRIRSAFPVAALFSGGLDSSAVTAMAAHILKGENKQLHAFSVVLPEKYRGTGTDEREYIDVYKNYKNIDLHYITNEQRGPFDDLDRLIWSGESPNYTSRHYQYTAFALQAKKTDCRVILDGVGGEFGASFHGDGIMAEWFLHGNWLMLVRELHARSIVEDRSLWVLIKGEVIRPFVPLFVARKRPRFDLQQSLQSSPVRKSFVTKYLGEDFSKQLTDVNLMVWPGPDHRKNQLRPLELLMGAGGGNGYVGYENVNYQYPFFDRRLLEFCLAAPSQFKIRNGYKRNLIRLGMKGILPDKLRLRTTKDSFGPDFHDRYNRQRPAIIKMLSQIRPGDPVREIVDVEKLMDMAQYQMQTNRCNTPMEFAAMHSVPRGIYLITFLKQFEHYWV